MTSATVICHSGNHAPYARMTPELEEDVIDGPNVAFSGLDDRCSHSQPEFRELRRSKDLCRTNKTFSTKVNSCSLPSDFTQRSENVGNTRRPCAEQTSANKIIPTCTEPESRPETSTVESISPDQLAPLLMLMSINCPSSALTVPPVVVVDCRTFISYNANHVTNAFNASCGDRFARKRLMAGRATVANLVSGGPGGQMTDSTAARETYRQLADKVAASEAGFFVAYDDNTTDMEVLPDMHPLRVLTSSLTSNGCRTKYLNGGLQAFHATHAALCSKPDDPPSRPFLYSPTTPVVELDVDSATISQILPYLFIGNERDAADRKLLREKGVTHVLNVTSHVPLYFEDDDSMTYRRIPATDSSCQNLKCYMDDSVAFIESARSSGGGVLVHCQAGVSRSPTLVLAYLMARYDRSVMDAFSFLKTRRPIVAPNFNFMGQLLDFEKRCQNGELKSAFSADLPPTPLDCCNSTF